MAGLSVTSLARVRDFKIPAYLASQDGVNLSVAGYRGNLLLAGIHIHSVPAAFPQFSASVLFQMPDPTPAASQSRHGDGLLKDFLTL